MFFLISKLVSFLFKPLTWIVILFLLGFVFKNPRKKRRSIKLGFLLLLFFSNPFIAREFIGMWEIYGVESLSIEKNYDVGIVLGGGIITETGYNKQKVFQHNPDRIMQALLLYKQGRIKKLN